MHRPPFGHGKGGDAGRDVGGGTPKKVLSLEVTQTVRDEGGCIGHAQDDCKFGSDCKFPHFSDAKLQKLEKEVVHARGKPSLW
jgi:hypothetical protein